MIGLSAHATLSLFVFGLSSVTAWVVPAILFVLVMIASWVGVRWAFSHEMSALRSAPLFNGLSTRQLRSVLSPAAPMEFSPGATIVKEGEASDAFFLIKEGTVKVLSGGNERATLGPSSYFGEISVIDGGRRTASVVAQTKVSALQLTSRGLTRTLERYPSIARLIFLKLRALLQAEAIPFPQKTPRSITRCSWNSVNACASIGTSTGRRQQLPVAGRFCADSPGFLLSATVALQPPGGLLIRL